MFIERLLNATALTCVAVYKAIYWLLERMLFIIWHVSFFLRNRVSIEFSPPWCNEKSHRLCICEGLVSIFMRWYSVRICLPFYYVM